MQVVAETEYQDIYRITNGVLLVVNKFDIDESTGSIYLNYAKTDLYDKNCQSSLRVIKKDFLHPYNNCIYPKGTVLYHGYIIKLLEDKSKWEYQIKTTGESFFGDADEMIEMLNKIIDAIRKE